MSPRQHAQVILDKTRILWQKELAEVENGKRELVTRHVVNGIQVGFHKKQANKQK